MVTGEPSALTNPGIDKSAQTGMIIARIILLILIIFHFHCEYIILSSLLPFIIHPGFTIVVYFELISSPLRYIQTQYQ
jgi:hypothetical protein